jgi:hypothetical protein
MLFTVEFTLEVEAATASMPQRRLYWAMRTTPEVSVVDVYSDAPESRHSHVAIDPRALVE